MFSPRVEAQRSRLVSAAGVAGVWTGEGYAPRPTCIVCRAKRRIAALRELVRAWAEIFTMPEEYEP